MANEPLTAEELAWANANADAIRSLRTQSNKQELSADQWAVDKDLIGSIAKDLILSMSRLESTIRKTIEQSEVSLARYKKMASKYNMDPVDIEQRDLAREEIADLEAKFPKLLLHQVALQRKIASLTQRPEECFLPLGTVVRFTGMPEHEDSLFRMDDRKSYPVIGSIGVVTGIKRDGEFPICVSLREPFKIGWGDEIRPGGDHLPTYFVERDMLEVEEYGLLPDGSEYLGYAFQPTHVRVPDRRQKQETEMILKSGGYYWNLHDFGPRQGIEALRAYESMDDFTWIEGPLEQFVVKGMPVSGLMKR